VINYVIYFFRSQIALPPFFSDRLLELSRTKWHLVSFLVGTKGPMRGVQMPFCSWQLQSQSEKSGVGHRLLKLSLLYKQDKMKIQINNKRAVIV
jgi:hypothetical protein